jgi:hypothetical protein
MVSRQSTPPKLKRELIQELDARAVRGEKLPEYRTQRAKKTVTRQPKRTKQLRQIQLQLLPQLNPIKIRKKRKLSLTLSR